LRAFLKRRAAMGSVYLQPYFLIMLADALLHLGEPAEASAAIQDRLARAEAGGEHLCTAELHRLSARAALAHDRLGDLRSIRAEMCAAYRAATRREIDWQDLRAAIAALSAIASLDQGLGVDARLAEIEAKLANGSAGREAPL
jgi:hypothetical protein